MRTYVYFFCVIAIEHDLETCVHVYQLSISRKLERYIILKLSITTIFLKHSKLLQIISKKY